MLVYHVEYQKCFFGCISVTPFYGDSVSVKNSLKKLNGCSGCSGVRCSFLLLPRPFSAAQLRFMVPCGPSLLKSQQCWFPPSWYFLYGNPRRPETGSPWIPHGNPKKHLPNLVMTNIANWKDSPCKKRTVNHLFRLAPSKNHGEL
jgi:hypothetical protein